MINIKITSLAGVVALFASLLFVSSSYAVTPPDDCFDFNAGSGTILGYYDNEGDDAANPACTKEVDIPTQIGGVNVVAIGTNAFRVMGIESVTFPATVMTIGDGAFFGNQISSLVIPSGVAVISQNAFYNNNISSLVLPEGLTDIGPSAFRYNQIATLTLPNSLSAIQLNSFANNQLTSVNFGNAVHSIGQSAFEFNQLESVVIPTTVTSINKNAFAHQTPGMNSDTALLLAGSVDPADWAQVRERITYTRVYIASLTNPNGLSNGVAVDLSTAHYPGSGTQFVTGGHLINPADLTVNYVDEDGLPLVGSHTLTGRLGSGDYLVDYNMMNGPIFISTGNEATDALTLDVYYRVGGVAFIDPESIDGYEDMDGISIVLSEANNSRDVVYLAAVDTPPVEDEDDEAADATGDADGDVLPETGASLYALLAAALGMVGAGATGVVRLKNQI